MTLENILKKGIEYVRNTVIMAAAGYILFFNTTNAQDISGRIIKDGQGKKAGIDLYLTDTNDQHLIWTAPADDSGEFRANNTTDVDEPTETESVGRINYKSTGLMNLELKQNSNIRVIRSDILGQHETLYDGEMSSGNNNIHIDMNNYAAGIYIIATEIDGKLYAKKFFWNKETCQYLTGEQTLNQTNTHKKYTDKSLQKTNSTLTLDSIIVKGENVEDLVDHQIVTGKRTIPYDIEIAGNTDLGDIEVGWEYMNLTGTLYGVDADPLHAPERLSGAQIWLGERREGYTTTDENGNFHMILKRVDNIDTLYAKKQGYTPRSLWILPEDGPEIIPVPRLNKDQNMKEYMITDAVDIDFFNFVYLRSNEGYPLPKPNEKYADTLTFYLVNPPGQKYINYTKDAIENGIKLFSGGKYSGKIIDDSTKAYGKIRWDNTIQGIGQIALYGPSSTRPIIDSVEITLEPLSDTDTSWWVEPAMSEVTKKEVGNSIYAQGDIKLPDNVPESWKQSMWYQGVDQILQPNWVPWDINYGVIAGKLPRGYIINAKRNPDPFEP